MEKLFDKLLSSPNVPKWIKYALSFLVCGIICAFGVVMAISVESWVGRILFIVVAGFSVVGFVSLCKEIKENEKENS